jgi:hypothetical protein
MKPPALRKQPVVGIRPGQGTECKTRTRCSVVMSLFFLLSFWGSLSLLPSAAEKGKEVIGRAREHLGVGGGAWPGVGGRSQVRGLWKREGRGWGGEDVRALRRTQPCQPFQKKSCGNVFFFLLRSDTNT